MPDSDNLPRLIVFPSDDAVDFPSFSDVSRRVFPAVFSRHLSARLCVCRPSDEVTKWPRDATRLPRFSAAAD